MVTVTQGFISVGGGSTLSGDSAPPPPPDLGAANFRKDIDLGLTQEHTLVMNTPPEQTLGLSVDAGVATLLTLPTIGLSVETFASGTVNQSQDLGLTQGSVLTMNNLPEKSAGFSIEQTWSYSGNKPIATATNIGSDNWSSVTNAQGTNTGTNATVSGQALNATDAQIRGQHVAVGTKDPLNIDLVQLRFFVGQTGTVLGNGGLELAYRIGSSGGWTTLEVFSNNVTSTVEIYNLTGIVTTWNDIRDLETRVRFNVAAGTPLVNATCDSVQLIIDASLLE